MNNNEAAPTRDEPPNPYPYPYPNPDAYNPPPARN
eukprot:CAMPEP_0174904026 /NCGR_PEP_ID=MMETSP0167-20121228/46670_1 /TAXON_ID=38298 /ORGANISM="Rhodella maculata, Strain CCMP736" /LENGTH=34 /DNA_ID= /DNA_START= /DNA_END= /DNA_ORIENTATION=